MTSYTYVNEAQIDVELLCNICQDPFRSPVNCTHCGHTVCHECITTWQRQSFSCPNCRQANANFIPVITRTIHNQLSRLLVKCTMCDEKNIQRGNYNDHYSNTCPKRIVHCPDGCGWKGCRENLAQHLINCQLDRQNLFRKSLWIAGGVVVSALSLYYLGFDMIK